MWQDIAALRKAAHWLAKPFEAGPHEPKGEDELNTTIGRLAAMSVAAYEKIRAAEAKRLCVRVTALDKLVAAERKEDCTVGQGKQLELPEPEPWPEPVDGAALIGGLEAAINRYVVLPKDAAFTCALWVLHAHCFDAFTCTPRLAITAPEKRCGKTTLSPFRSTCGGAFRCRWSDRQAYLAASLFVRWQPGRRSKKPLGRDRRQRSE